jgi:hypothetical protein
MLAYLQDSMMMEKFETDNFLYELSLENDTFPTKYSSACLKFWK